MNRFPDQPVEGLYRIDNSHLITYHFSGTLGGSGSDL